MTAAVPHAPLLFVVVECRECGPWTIESMDKKRPGCVSRAESNNQHDVEVNTNDTTKIVATTTNGLRGAQ